MVVIFSTYNNIVRNIITRFRQALHLRQPNRFHDPTKVSANTPAVLPQVVVMEINITTHFLRQ